MTFGFAELTTELLRPVIDAIVCHPDEPAPRREAKTQMVVHSVMSFCPRDAAEIMLSGQTVLYQALILDSGRESLSGQLETMKLRYRQNLTAMTKVQLACLNQVRLLQTRRAEGERTADPVWAAITPMPVQTVPATPMPVTPMPVQAEPPRQPSPPRPAMQPSGAQGPVAAPVAAMARVVAGADGSGADGPGADGPGAGRARVDVPARDVRVSAIPVQDAAVRAVSSHGSLESAAVHAAAPDADRESLKQRLLGSTPYDVALRAAIDWAVSDGPASGTAIAAARRAASGEDTRPPVSAANASAANASSANVSAPNASSANVSAPNTSSPNASAPNVSAPNVSSANARG